MKFEIQFDKEIYNEQMDLLFDLAYKDKIFYYKNAQYLGVILIVIASFLIYNRPNILGLGYVFLAFGLSSLLPFVYYYFKIKSNYKKFDSAKLEEIKANEDVEKFSLEFTDESFIVNFGKDVKVTDWTEFLLYLIKEDNLILITKDHSPYILGKIEVGDVDFDRILAFVKQKIKLNHDEL